MCLKKTLGQSDRAQAVHLHRTMVHQNHSDKQFYHLQGSGHYFEFFHKIFISFKIANIIIAVNITAVIIADAITLAVNVSAGIIITAINAAIVIDVIITVVMIFVTILDL